MDRGMQQTFKTARFSACAVGDEDEECATSEGVVRFAIQFADVLGVFQPLTVSYLSLAFIFR